MLHDLLGISLILFIYFVTFLEPWERKGKNKTVNLTAAFGLGCSYCLVLISLAYGKEQKLSDTMWIQDLYSLVLLRVCC